MQVQPYTSEISELSRDVISLLKELIATPSFSGQEDKTCGLIESFLQSRIIPLTRKKNNIWVRNKYFDPAKRTILLNSHHDTVKPNPMYTRDPFEPAVEDGKLFGLGSNDAGGCLMALLACFLHFYHRDDLKYNFIFSATAEEENSGTEGVSLIIPDLPEIDFAVVGEPTKMNMGIAEKGLMVLDCVVEGKAGHAAREEGDNAIYKAIPVIEWFRNYSFDKVSPLLGPVKMTVTIIRAGEQHNVVPGICEFTVDVRTTDAYTNDEVLEIIRKNVSCKITPRSLRLQPSSISSDHPFVVAGGIAGRSSFASPTTSDQALMSWNSLKMGPGDSARSHSADEFVYLSEIEEAIGIYISIFDKLNL